MPELPEVETVLRALKDGLPSLEGRRIKSVNMIWGGVVPVEQVDIFKKLQGFKFTQFFRHGKYLMFTLEPADADYTKNKILVVHLRMTGRLFIVPDNQAVERHTRFSVRLDEGLSLRFDDPRKFGRVWLVENICQVTDKLGPDALTVSWPDFQKRIDISRRQLKPLLLDQAFISGIGNIYADEILFRAKLHPLTVSSNLSVKQKHHLHETLISVLQEALLANGANIDGVFKAGSFVVAVYGKDGDNCHICGETIMKTRVGQRGTHYCPGCQIAI